MGSNPLGVASLIHVPLHVTYSKKGLNSNIHCKMSLHSPHLLLPGDEIDLESKMRKKNDNAFPLPRRDLRSGRAILETLVC